MPSHRLSWQFTACFMASLAPWATFAAPAQPLDITADDIQYDTSGSTITATGNVNAQGPQGNLQADKMVYDTQKGQVMAEGKVSFTTPGASQTIQVDKLTINDKLQTGDVHNIHLSLADMGEIMQAKEGNIISPTLYQLKDITYSPCTGCEGRKPWSLSASQVQYDRTEAKATYKHAVLDVYGVPVLYLPYFSHPLGAQKPRNGLLPPQFGHSTAYGDSAILSGYVYNPAENADYTLRTRLMSKRGGLIQLERRQETLTTNSEIRGSYLNDTSTGQTRSNFMASGEKTFRQGQRIGLNADLASDDTYVNQYFNRTAPYLASTLYAEDGRDDHYLALSATHFYDLIPTRDPAQTAQILPHIQAEQMVELQGIGGQFTVGGDIVNLSRGQGSQSRRIVTNAGYKKPFIMADGSKLEAGATLRLDSYNVDSSGNNGTTSRALPEATLSWEKPYLSPSGFHTITPRVVAAMGPRGGNPAGIPNEDSVAYELDASNLFATNRFAGLDRVETGPRLMYGLDNRWGTPGSTTYRLFIGESLRKFDSVSLPASGGASKNFSDWVGTAEAAPRDWLDFAQSFRLDQATLTPQRLDTSLRLGTEKKGRFLATYSFLNNGPENITTDLKVPLNEAWTFLGKTQHDLQAQSLLLAEGGLEVKRNCYKIGFTARRRGFTNGDIQPSTDYLVNFQLLTLGTD